MGTCLKLQLAAFLIMASFFMSPASAATLTATPSNVSPGGVTSVSWTGGGTARDWVALFRAGAGNGSYLSWAYVSCSQNPTVAFASGSCFFALPNTTGNYEFRFFYNDGFTLLASTSVTVSSLPVVSFSVSSASVLESNTGSQARLVVSRTGSMAGSMVVNYTVSGGSNGATAGQDYNILPGSVTIQPGSSTANIDIVPINDGSAEGDETVVVTLVASAGVYTLGSPGVGTATIQDDEPPLPSVTIAATDNQATEGTPATDTGSFTITRTGSTAAPMVVNFTLGGTASGGDYNLSSAAVLTATTVTIPAGSSSVVITLTPVNDTDNEGNETVVMTLATNPGVYTIGAPSNATITIVDNDAPAGPSLVASPASVAPGTGVTVSWSGLTSPTARDWIGAYNNPGANNASFIGWTYVSCFQSPVLPVASGACNFGLPSTIGTYEFRLFFNDGFTRLATSNPVTVSSLPVVSFSVSSASVLESNTGSQARLVVSRTGSTAGSMLVNYTVSGGSNGATAGQDYNILPGSVTIQPGSSTANIDIVPINDGSAEGDETVVVTLVANAGVYTVGTPGVGTATIQDDEPPLPSVTIAATDNQATEGTPATDTGSFTITRTGSTAAPMVVNFTLGGTASGGDYNLSSAAVLTATTVTMPSGSSSVVITLTPVNDTDNEGNETAVMTLATNPGVYTIGAPANATITIVDNDAPAGPSLTAAPTSMVQGNNVTASWSGIPFPTGRDWIGLFTPGAGDGGFLNWAYVNCTRNPTVGFASGSCPLLVPGSLASGIYQLRLFSNDSYTRLATSNNFVVSSLSISGATLNATVNVFFSQTLTATGGTAPYTWSVIAGSLPGGITLQTNGTISGTATAISSNNFTVQVQDGLGSTASRQFSISVTDPTVLNIVSTSLTSGKVNQTYNFALGASGGTTPYTWSVISGNLPLGLSLSTNGTISGVALGVGASRFLVQVRDGANVTVSKSFILTTTSSGPKPLKGYWSFDDGTATDNSGFNISSTAVNNPSVVPGRFGNALSFDGVNQYVNASDHDLDAGSGELSIFAWVKTTQAGGSKMIVSKRDGSSASNGGYQLFQNSNNALSFILGNDSGTVLRHDSTGPAINDGNWHFVGVVFNRNSISGQGVLYVDGVRATIGTADVSSINGNNVASFAALRIGGEAQNSSIYRWNGAIDEVQVFTRRVFSDAEVLALYNRPLAITSNSLPAAAANIPYKQTLTSTGGVDPYTWSIAIGALPAGLSLSPAGVISGAPTATGTFNFTARLDDVALGTTTQPFSLNVSGVAPQVLLNDNFSAGVGNWGVIDEGTAEGPADWVIVSGFDLLQRSNSFAGGVAAGDLLKPGTYALYTGTLSSSDYDISLRIMSEDNDDVGVMFRYQNGQNYYRFSLDSERRYRRLIKVVGGVPTLLGEDGLPYELGQVYGLRISVNGSQIKVYVDNREIISVTDSSLPTGNKIALYTWGNEYGHFGDVLVTH